MARRASIILSFCAAALTISHAPGLSALPAEHNDPVPQPRMVEVPGRGTVLVQPYVTDDPDAVARMVTAPGGGEAYLVPVRPKDARNDRQRCVDSEIERIGGTPSDLDRASIDLKCSQR